MENTYLSVIIPCYNEEENIEIFYNEIKVALGKLINKTELIFVNDGSTDKTLESLKKVYETHEYNVKIIDFSRNFGKESALLVGLEKSNGKYVAIIDADLQQNPKYIVEMLDILKNNPNYDAVAAYQELRKESKIASLYKKCFYKVLNRMMEVEIKEAASDFRVLKRNVVEAILSLPEKSRFSKGIFSWIGFNTYYMPYMVEERRYGTSKWKFSNLLKYGIEGIVSFSGKPLMISNYIGIIMVIDSILGFIIMFILNSICNKDINMIWCAMLLIILVSGIQLISIGIIGIYLLKNYIETKNRPAYIVRNVIENKDIKEEKNEKYINYGKRRIC